MATKQLKGVGGVLGNLISPEAEQPTPPEPPAKPVPLPPAAEQVVSPMAEPSEAPPAIDKAPRKPQERTQARRGRPPGRKAGEAADKEKVTLRLSKEVMDDYREWSWESRKNVGELVDEALIFYRKHRTRQKSQ